MRRPFLYAPWVLLALLSAGAQGQDLTSIELREAYVELHSSLGRGYPVREIAERGEQLLILKRRAGWYKLRTPRQVEGWAPASQLRESLSAAGIGLPPVSSAARPPRPVMAAATGQGAPA